MSERLPYRRFLEAKALTAPASGIVVDPQDLNPRLRPVTQAVVPWLLKGGRRAAFLKFGLHKTATQIETMRLLAPHCARPRGIVLPLGVRREFFADAARHFLGPHAVDLRFVRHGREIDSTAPIYLTNYEAVREGNVDAGLFEAVSLDEASILRSYGSKTYQEFTAAFAATRFKFVATATPAPNRTKELIHYAGFLGVMDTGQALAQPLSAKVLTPTGWRRMGELAAGDAVIAGDGRSTRVLGVYPQGEKPIYRVTFSDGAIARCTGDHLWLTRTQYQRNAATKYLQRNPSAGTGHYWSVRPTDEIASTLIAPGNGAKNHEVPLVAPVLMQPQAVPVDPWLLGILLGDGCLRKTSITLSSADAWILDRAAEIVAPDGLTLRKTMSVRADGGPCYDYVISGGKINRRGRGHHSNPLLHGVGELALLGKRAWEKHIPDAYKFNTPAVRLAVLQGLMDADGTIAEHAGNRTPRFTTTSRVLADDVAFLVRSLGGTAHVYARPGRTPSGAEGREQYVITLRLPNGTNPFQLPRKAGLVVARSKYVPRRFIVSVEPDGCEAAQCIAVEHPDRLYVTDDLVVTHNTRFFQRNSEKAGDLTLYPHMEREFWLWCASWGAFVARPSDLGLSDEGYDLPPLTVRWHEVPVDMGGEADRDGQHALFRDGAKGLAQEARERNSAIPAVTSRVAGIIAAAPADHFVIWHDLEAERKAIERAIPNAVSVFGGQALEEREARIGAFADGLSRILSTKPILAGSGTNIQPHCHRAVYAGVGHKFNDFIQSCHRLQRYGQQYPVEIDIVYPESMREARRDLEAKWVRHEEQEARMSAIIQAHGLDGFGLRAEMCRAIGTNRIEAAGERWRIINEDCVLEAERLAENSVDLIVTSIPFSKQYEYSPNKADLGHVDDDAHFFDHLGYLTPELLRVLKPGRLACIHVKDNIVFGSVSGYGTPTVNPFHAKTLFHYQEHGFAYMGLIFIDTDVVRENNQTYRLGWSENGKDSTKMGVGSPEFVLIFRKLPTDRSRSYADDPVTKAKPHCLTAEGGLVPFDERLPPEPGSGYSRARWQVDAHARWRSSGDRLVSASEMTKLSPDALARVFRDFSLKEIYDHETHVRIGEELAQRFALPATFLSLWPGSVREDVWTDIARMRTLNTEQAMKGREKHLCLARGSLVLTYHRGYVPIETVEPGDLVLTHQGRWRPVTVARCTGVQQVVTLKAQGVPGLTLTPDHKLWTRKVRDLPWSQNHSKREAAQTDPSWIEAAQTAGSYINLKLPPSEEATPTDYQYWWIVGRWLADGHIGSRGDLFISCGAHEVEDLTTRLGAVGAVHAFDTGTAHQIRLRDPNRSLRDTIERCGKGAVGKRLPPIGYTLPTDQAAALLDGYLSGDGHYRADRNRWTASSVSKELLLGIAMLAQRVHGAVASIYPGRPGGTVVIQGRTVTTQQDWVLCFDVPDADRAKGLPFVLEDGAWKKVREIDPAGEAETWCLRVEEDESFTAEGCIVKNCPLQFDIVDRLIRRYSNPDDLVFDPFAGLGTVPLRAVKMGRRGLGSELNTGYFADAVTYLQAQDRRQSTPSLFDFLAAEVAPAVAAE